MFICHNQTDAAAMLCAPFTRSIVQQDAPVKAACIDVPRKRPTLDAIRQLQPMLATIVIAAYQLPLSVGAAVRSALEQSWADLEVIVVDDASGDETARAAQIAACDDRRFRLIQLQKNSGVSAARNAGLDVARGEWIAFLDADDTLQSNRLATMIPLALASGVDLFADNLAVRWTDASYPDHLAFPHLRMLEGRAVSAGAFASTDRPRWGLRAAGYIKPIIRRSFLDARSLRFPQELRRSEDFHFYMQCLLRGGILRYYDYAGYNYVVRSGSLSAVGEGRIGNDRIESNRQLTHEAIELDNHAAAGELRKRQRDIESWDDCVAIRNALRSKDYSSAATTFAAMHSKSYAFARIGEKAYKELSFRLGRSNY